jgi:hypothetical protein
MGARLPISQVALRPRSRRHTAERNGGSPAQLTGEVLPTWVTEELRFVGERLQRAGWDENGVVQTLRFLIGVVRVTHCPYPLVTDDPLLCNSYIWTDLPYELVCIYAESTQNFVEGILLPPFRSFRHLCVQATMARVACGLKVRGHYAKIAT